jgi:hypothetical protein
VTGRRPVLQANVLAAVAPVQLQAEAAVVEGVDVERRTITGLVVPYGQPGRTNLGVGFPVRAGAVRFREPHRRVIGVYGHTGLPGQPKPVAPEGTSVARMVAYEDRPQGLAMRFKVPATPLGDQLLAEAHPTEGTRSSLSIELVDVQLDPWSGDIVSGLCEFVAFVPLGAYDDAQVTSVAASLHYPTPEGDDVRRRLTPFARNFIEIGGGGQQQQAPQPQGQAVPQQQQAPAQPLQPQPQVQHQLAPLQAQQQAPQQQQQAPAQPFDYAALAAFAQAQGLLQAQQAGSPAFGQQLPQQAPQAVQVPSPAGALGHGAVPSPGQQPSAGPKGTGAIRRMAQLQAQAYRQGGFTPQLQAALADITPNSGGLDLFDAPAGVIGEQLWSGEDAYERRYTPLMRQKDLTSWSGTGWEWVVKPKVQAYEGNKAPIPTNTVSVQPKEWEAQRAAAGWDVDRKFKDFGDAAFWEGFYAAQTDSYRELTDEWAVEAIVAAAKDITTDANVPTAYQGVNVAQADIFKAAALGNAILEDTKNVKRSASYVLMNSADWLQLLNYTNLDLPAFLQLLGVKPEQFMRTGDVPAGSLVLGVTQAMTFRELGGGAPIRVEALNVAQAGVDSAVYGYCAYSLDRPGGVISVPLVAPAP